MRLCGRGVHSLPVNSLLDHISRALSVATGRIPSLFCAMYVYSLSLPQQKHTIKLNIVICHSCIVIKLLHQLRVDAGK